VPLCVGEPADGLDIFLDELLLAGTSVSTRR